MSSFLTSSTVRRSTNKLLNTNDNNNKNINYNSIKINNVKNNQILKTNNDQTIIGVEQLELYDIKNLNLTITTINQQFNVVNNRLLILENENIKLKLIIMELLNITIL
jgi:hypothetical protein